MATVTIRPDGTYANASGQTGSISALSDASDSTWMAWASGGGIRVALANPTIPAGAQIRTVRIFWRASTSTGTALHTARVYSDYPSGKYTAITAGSTASTTVATYSSSLMAADPAGAAWTVTAVNNLSVQFGFAANMRLNDVWAEVVYNLPPSVNATAPTGTYTASVRPLITWDYSDTEGDAQERYSVRVFSAAQYSVGGFDPATSPATWESGVVYSGAGQANVGVNLANGGTYRAYVQASDVGSNGRFSAWDYTAFTIAVATPSTPGLVATYAADTTVTLLGTGLTSGNGIVVERSDDSGDTWLPVRGSHGWIAAGSSFTGYDYEAPCNTISEYRAWQWDTDGFGNIFASGYSPVQSLLVNNTVWRLKDPAAPGVQLPISLRDNLQVTSPRLEGIFDPIGSDVAIVLVDANPGGDRIPLPLQFKTDADYRAFVALRRTGHVLQLVSDTTDQWYVQLTGDQQTTTQMSAVRRNTPYRTLDITAIAVGAPPDLTVMPGV